MPPVSIINSRDINRYRHLWLPAVRRGVCTCARYTFYLECGHLCGMPRFYACGLTIDHGSGRGPLQPLPPRSLGGERQ
ncbi:hypothetical protein C8A03DRAFT_36927 [Achaetomium macrosporum]|uniref:Uncharacterized protein n=1 Tax=Achaetomium macrosporum TaxID=79813 RepID=A0AAN7C4G6_9PEZI|nr:hypothetical protein C8A03DRAFT_36927 [Achaetomium macrosporum]